jgi:hypothetical protein
MNAKQALPIFIGLVLPWLLIIIGLALETYNVWLYVGSIAWFVTAVVIFLSLYK